MENFRKCTNCTCEWGVWIRELGYIRKVGFKEKNGKTE